MRVWIDQYEGIGAGTCEQIAPEVFVSRSAGVSVVTEDPADFGTATTFDGSGSPGHGPDGLAGRARVPASLLAAALEAAEECPGDCTYTGL
jgi:ferredoxin